MQNRTRSAERIRTRYEPPTLAEAIVAAQGLADDLDAQTEIAAALMGMLQADVRPAVIAAEAPARPVLRSHAPARAVPQTVIVERRRPRVLIR
ncbi:hypothetical protein [Microvirga pudoricolor]|uniref:hypothetical protein n=1 Tax=Microvirga pudoricolor TaxID=2778729 RepID=UPI00194F7315|nr:hypothetical protein [Microvirga pudoricolor]MBM6593643.1 hypothetical protein [Microvirga pudoricolor]